ncbi:MAG: YegP family protein [Methanomassiliicoccaceae archaeon]|nr:YegP family protein [Methanomassiliicoccaceae archaeon]
MSQVYSSLSACKAGIESIRKNCGAKIEDQTLKSFETLTNPKYELYVDKANEYRFRLKASNGENILASHGYASKSGCKNGIDSIARNAPDADVIKEE